MVSYILKIYQYKILFRDKEAEIRRKMIEDDLVECVIGLGPNLFYNSPMEACLLITKTNKEENKKGKILFINKKILSNGGVLEISKLTPTLLDFFETLAIDKIIPIQKK